LERLNSFADAGFSASKQTKNQKDKQNIIKNKIYAGKGSDLGQNVMK